MLEQIQSFLSEPVQQEQHQLRVVEIYIRIVTTKSIKIKLPSQVQVIKLKQIIKQKFKIKIQDQILFLKGIKLNFDGIVLLQNKWIIHVIDKRLVDNQFISFHVKTQSLNHFKKELPTYYTVKSDEILQQFIQNNILKQFSVSLSEVLIVESGRFLKLNQTFKDQYVQSGTEINILHVQRDKNKSVSSVNSSNEKYSNKLIQGFQDKNPSNIHPKLKIQQLELQLKNDNLKKKNKIFQTSQRVSNKIITARNHWPGQSNNASNKFNKFNKTTTSNLYLNSPRINQVHPKNKSIPVVVMGHKQCNCRPKKEKQVQILSLQDRKKRQKQIRQMNLQKLIIKKQKQNQRQSSTASLVQEQGKQQSSLFSSSSKLKKVKSLNILNTLNNHPQKQQKCQIHNLQNQQKQIDFQQLLHLKNNPQKKHAQQTKFQKEKEQLQSGFRLDQTHTQTKREMCNF